MGVGGRDEVCVQCVGGQPWVGRRRNSGAGGISGGLFATTLTVPVLERHPLTHTLHLSAQLQPLCSGPVQGAQLRVHLRTRRLLLLVRFAVGL